MGDAVNVLIDDLEALLYRMMGLPLAFQLFVWASLWSLLLFLAFRALGFFQEREMPFRVRAWLYSFSILSIIILVTSGVYDHHRFIDEQEKLLRSQRSIRSPLDQYDPTTLLSKRMERLGGLRFADSVEIVPLQQEVGLSVFQLSFQQPLIVGFIAYVDLDRFDVVLDTAISTKEKTSDFAQRLKATVAVNGEAGTTPGLGAPLGPWTGNYMVNGQVIKLEDSSERPFIWFDKKGDGHYSRESDVVRKMPADACDAIWGRFDLLIDGKSAISEKDMTRTNHYPRTIVGMDSTGREMILLVADGRRPLYSRGMKMDMCAETMMAAGAWNAMACDQGGSSELWTKSLGVVNRPADGVERPVYTHLGFAPERR